MTEPSPAPRRQAKLLIVEDEPRMREVLLRAAESWNLLTSSARSGEEALRIMESAPNDIILLDLNLPGMSGMDCFETLRQRWPKTQVVILTGFGDLDAAKRAIHLDVVEFLTKPCHLGDLERAIDRARRRLEPLGPEPPAPEPPKSPEPSPQTEPGTTLDEMERQAIMAALARNHGNRTATAAELGISLRTLYYRLSEYQRQGYNVD